MRRGTTSSALLGLSGLLMLVGGMGHTLAFHRAAEVIEASNLSKQYAAIFLGLWLSIAAMLILVGLAYLILALWPRLGTKTALGVLGALPLTCAILLYSTVGNFAPAHLLLVSGTMVLIAALLCPEGMRRSAMPATAGLQPGDTNTL